MKIKCSEENCNEFATWLYMPGFSGSESYKDNYLCDNHVHRGCNCNLELKDEFEHIYNEDNPNIGPILIQIKSTLEIREAKEDDYEMLKDEQGRELPCCEYEYEANGFEEIIEQ